MSSMSTVVKFYLPMNYGWKTIRVLTPTTCIGGHISKSAKYFTYTQFLCFVETHCDLYASYFNTTLKTTFRFRFTKLGLYLGCDVMHFNFGFPYVEASDFNVGGRTDT